MCASMTCWPSFSSNHARALNSLGRNSSNHLQLVHERHGKMHTAPSKEANGPVIMQYFHLLSLPSTPLPFSAGGVCDCVFSVLITFTVIVVFALWVKPRTHGPLARLQGRVVSVGVPARSCVSHVYSNWHVCLAIQASNKRGRGESWHDSHAP